jgi:hypothetical protein
VGLRPRLGWVLLLAALPGAATAGPGAEGAAAGAFAPGRTALGLAAGYGFGVDLFGSGGTENEEVSFAAFVPSFWIAPFGLLGGDGWGAGSFGLGLEGGLLANAEPRSGVAGSAALAARYHWLPPALRGGRLVPFLELSLGIGGLDFDLQSQDDGFNFFLQGGAGVHWLLSRRTALTSGWRYHHISNAGTRRPNIGINSHLFLFGVSVFLDQPGAGASRAGARPRRPPPRGRRPVRMERLVRPPALGLRRGRPRRLPPDAGP